MFFDMEECIWQKLCPSLQNKVVQYSSYQKMLTLKFFLSFQYLYKKIIFRKIKSFFDAVKWSEKSEFSHLCPLCFQKISENI